MPKTILLLSAYHPELLRGGSQVVCHELFEELQAHSQGRCYFLASVDDSYPALFKSGARITGFDGRANEFLFLSRHHDYWWHKAGDPLVVASFIEFLQVTKPDVVHFHHFMTLGIDLITVVRRVQPSCRIIVTFHEFLAICAADGHMVRRSDRSLCGRATSVRCHQCFPERRPEEFFVRKMWFMQHLRHVDRFTCPSRFMIEHYVNWGIPRDKIVHVPNGQRQYGPVPIGGGGQVKRNRFGFFGQLHDAKGAHIVLRAVHSLRESGFTDFTVDLNGTNIQCASPEVRQEIETFLAAEKKRPLNAQNVFYNGSYHLDQLHTRMARIDWCLVPSVWWEIFGLVISEAWMFGKPVICSNVGGMAERVKDEVDGLHFEMANPRDLADVIRRACTEDGLWQKLHDALPAYPRREVMADNFLRLYDDADNEPA
nr:glycosyltransferase [uncultured Rhodopila sp.]